MKKQLSEFVKKDTAHFKVAIFGSSRVKEGDKIYNEVKNLAAALGERGIDVITGGGPGIMTAGNAGHKIGQEKNGNGSHSIGIGVRLPWVQKFNDSVEYKEEFNRFSRRLDEFMLLSNAVVVAPGGLGTTLELFYTWQLVQVHHICNIPIILMGHEWKGLLKWVKKQPLKKRYLDKEDYDMVFYARNRAEVLKILEEAYESFKVGGKNFCLNYKKYKLK